MNNNIVKLDINKIINVINIHNAMLTVKELLILIGYEFNSLYIDKFWENIEDDKWIYINNDMLIYIGYANNDINSSKRKYLNILKGNFEENNDYKLLNLNEFKQNSKCPTGHLEYKELNTHNKVKYLIVSPDCFKQSLMMIRTEKAKEIRKYYTELEKIFRFYILYQNKYQELKVETHKLQLQEAENILKLKDLKLEEEINKNKILHNRMITTQLLEFIEYIYVITTINYAKESIFLFF